jgi:hypothetical protein
MTSFYSPQGQAPKGICSVDSYDVSISNLTIENIETGIYWWRGTLKVDDCTFRRFTNGISCWVDGGSIRDCRFEISDDGAALGPGLTDALSVERCSFVGYGLGFSTGASAHNIDFANCEFRDNRTSMAFDRWSIGTITNTTIAGSISAGLMVTYNSQVELEGVHIEGGEYGLFVSSGSVVNGSNVIIEGTSVAALFVAAEARVTLRNSHLLPASGLGVLAIAYTGIPVVLDLSGNYWGTTDTAIIDGMISDGNDDPAVHATVQYLPIANGPVPTDATSWGSVKSMFR